MAKTIQQIDLDYYFQHPGKTLLDLADFLNAPEIIANYPFQRSLTTFLQLAQKAGAAKLLTDYIFQNEGQRIRSLIEFLKAGGGTFNPMSLAWGFAMQAYDASTLFSDSAGTIPATTQVACAKDKSGNARDITQTGVATLRPVKGTLSNGAPALIFDGVDDFLSNTTYALPFEGTMFVLMEFVGASTSDIYIGGPSTSSGRRQLCTTVAGNISAGYGGFNGDTVTLDTGVAAAINTPFIMCLDCKGNFVDLYINGGIPKVNNQNLSSLAPQAGFYVGRFAGGGFPANIAVSDIYITQEGVRLTQTQRDNMGAYLAQVGNGIW